jgi:hypothetical protein
MISNSDVDVGNTALNESASIPERLENTMRDKGLCRSQELNV